MYSEAEKDIIKKRILEEVEAKRSIHDILGNDLLGEFPSPPTVYGWLNEKDATFDEAFSNNYERARDIRAEKIFDEILTLADSTDDITYLDKNGAKRIDWGKVQRNKTQIDARKWVLSRMKPKKYGDKMETTIQGGDVPLKTEADYSNMSPELLEELAKQTTSTK